MKLRWYCVGFFETLCEVQSHLCTCITAVWEFGSAEPILLSLARFPLTFSASPILRRNLLACAYTSKDCAYVGYWGHMERNLAELTDLRKLEPKRNGKTDRRVWTWGAGEDPEGLTAPSSLPQSPEFH